MRTNPHSQRKRPPRRGSVMIMVVALLLLLFLIGTALIATTRSDRAAAGTSLNAAQIDATEQSALSMLARAVADDLFGRRAGTSEPLLYRPPSSAVDPAQVFTYRHWDALTDTPADLVNGLFFNLFLAERIPSLLNPAGALAPNNPPVWRAITWPLWQNGDVPVAPAPLYQLDVPRLFLPTDVSSVTLDPSRRQFYRFVPTQMPGTPPNEPPQAGFVILDWEPPAPPVVVTAPNGQTIFPAADADGDGIADSIYWRAPMPTVDGITWFYAMRVIDNNSAINVNTAWSVVSDFAGSPLQQLLSVNNERINPAIFPSAVGLQELMVDNQDPAPVQMPRIHLYRANGGIHDLTAYPRWDDSSTRPDFAFTTHGEALFFQLTRRIENPGLRSWIGANNYQHYRALPIADMMAIAAPFAVRNPSASPSTLEWLAAESLLGSPRVPFVRSAPYSSTDAGRDTWFAENFDYMNPVMSFPVNRFSLRPLLVTRNGVSELIPARSAAPLGVNPYAVWPGMPAYPNTPSIKPARACINTSTFGELWRAYWNVMSDTGFTTPFGTGESTDLYDGSKFNSGSFAADTTQNLQRMFRSPLRVPASKLGGADERRLSPIQTLLLRAALAAINAESQRQPDRNSVLWHTIPLGDYTAIIYGAQPQPFISEIYVNNDRYTDKGAGTNPNGYIAIELVNPYAAPLSLNGWSVAYVDRNTFPALNVQILHTFDAGDVIPAATAATHGYVVLDNVGSEPSDAKFRPQASGLDPLPGGVTIIYVRGLHQALGRELVLLRPVKGAPACPVDSFDFSGFPSPSESGGPPPNQAELTAWHYLRANDSNGHRWQFVYPGRYDGSVSSRRHQGTEQEQWSIVLPPTGTEGDSWKNGKTPPINLGRPDADATYPDVFTIQWMNFDWLGDRRIQSDPGGANPPNRFPFGGFPRNGDILQVPFIGAYRIYEGNNLVELNAVTMDSAFAEDTDTTNNATEQIGRFCPTGDPLAGTFDWGGDPAFYRYAWAKDLFDYLTVRSPNPDFFPDASPDAYGNVAVQPPPPQPVANTAMAASPGVNVLEQLVATQGLININTAHWRVLSMLPLVVHPVTGEVCRAETEALARQIVAYREQFGPFTSIFDLQKVYDPTDPNTNWWQKRGFATMWGMYDLNAFDFGDRHGDFSPPDPAFPGRGGADVTDGVLRDFESTFLNLTRISNLITTRSDSFTAYVLVQGWKDAGTTAAQLVYERRAAYYIDRSNVAGPGQMPRSVRVPMK